jgi:hypothetical protein
MLATCGVMDESMRVEDRSGFVRHFFTLLSALRFGLDRPWPPFVSIERTKSSRILSSACRSSGSSGEIRTRPTAERGTRDRNRPPDRTSSSSRSSVSLTLRCPRDAWARSHSRFSGDRVTEIGLFIGQLYDIYTSSHQTGCSPNGLNRLTPPKTKFVPLFLLFRSRTEEKQSHSSWRYRRMANGSRTYPTSRERARFTSAHSDGPRHRGHRIPGGKSGSSFRGYSPRTPRNQPVR